MIAALLLQAVAAVPMPPQDWSPLPELPLPRIAATAEGSAFVRAEVESGRCKPPAPADGDAPRIVAPVAILIGPGGTVSRIVPRAIGCPTVEQYTVGTLLSLTRGGFGGGPGGVLPPAAGWYRLAVPYRW